MNYQVNLGHKWCCQVHLNWRTHIFTHLCLGNIWFLDSHDTLFFIWHLTYSFYAGNLLAVGLSLMRLINQAAFFVVSWSPFLCILKNSSLSVNVHMNWRNHDHLSKNRCSLEYLWDAFQTLHVRCISPIFQCNCSFLEIFFWLTLQLCPLISRIRTLTYLSSIFQKLRRADKFLEVTTKEACR